MKTLHMIGFSHIDLVWFWDREEGLQEVRASFRSVLDRIKEFPDFRFTCTSAVMLDHIRRFDPEMFQSIQEQAHLDRIEITGGWWTEPDCNLPNGEALVRQGLYGQKFFREAFGQIARIGGNVDSFGHTASIPQIIRGCGMDRYYFMRPRLTNPGPEVVKKSPPLVSWQSPDGSAVTALSLPAEYTCWFEETLRDNIIQTMAFLDSYPALPCFYGVGNHGGGPTIANIKAVSKLRSEFPSVSMPLSTLTAFFDETEHLEKPVYSSYLEGVNTGCYNVDHLFKHKMRQAEQALLRAERFNAMVILSGSGQYIHAERLESLWKRLLFCQFHDTLGGTAIKKGRDNAENDMAGILAEAEELTFSSLTRLTLRQNTLGEGVPVFIFNDTAKPYSGVLDLELNWFCKDPLTLIDSEGKEIPYQLTKTACTMRWYRLGGRRRVLFHAEVPAFGYALIRAVARTPECAPIAGVPEHDIRVFENDFVKAEFDEKGQLVSLTDKASSYQSLGSAVHFEVWDDQRDSWGHGKDNRLHQVSDERFETSEIRVVEAGKMRSALLIRQKSPSCRLDLLYSLDAGSKALKLSVKAFWDGPWKSLKMRVPSAGQYTACSAEGAYCLLNRAPSSTEYYMHRAVDAKNHAGSGLAIANDGVYSFGLQNDSLSLTLLRSAIISHGDCIGWENEHDVYDYNDLGMHEYEFLFQPHGAPLPSDELLSLADRLSSPPVLLADHCHEGNYLEPKAGFLEIADPAIRLGAFKPAEDGRGLILRLQEIAGQSCLTRIRIGLLEIEQSFRAYEIKSFRVYGEQITEVNLLEDSI